MTLEHVQVDPVSRRKFIGGIGAAVAAGSLGSIGFATRAAAAPPSFLGGPTPKAIPGVVPTGVPDAPFDEIHWWLPGPDGSATQFNALPGFGLDVDPSTITDFDGFTAYAVIAGSGTGDDGENYDVELDVRVMDGRFVAEDGGTHHGTFGFF